VSLSGESFLIDGDYLVRNTTEHNMVSLLKDGRANELEPVCAGLQHHADLETTGFTQSVVRGWNKCDWTRSIFWKKGDFFVVIDAIDPQEPGDYTAECTWKMLDRGEQSFLDGRTVKVSLSGEGHVGNRDLATVPAEGASEGQAVKFLTPDAQLDFLGELPAGEYVVTLFACGLDTSTDSFWLSVDGGEKIAFHIPIETFGPSARTHTKDTPTPNVVLTKGGTHRFTLTLRENPGVLLDRIVIADRKGTEVAAFEAEDAPEIPRERQRKAPTKDFYLIGDGAARAKVTARVNHVGQRLKYLKQRLGIQLQ
jgi:hypothetical protein